ncbi:MAG: class I SAM-dependent methyltransferase [Candidatus Hodarchaeales archaeon]|jgi:SAM-dependent methyltransferase
MIQEADWTLLELAHENNELNKGYFSSGNYKNYGAFMKAVDAVRFILSSENRSTMSLLDVGCGSGWQAVCFNKEGVNLKYSGLDVSPHMCKFARENYSNGEFFVADITKDNLNKKFDIVIESAVIELVSDWKKCVDGMIKHSNGWIIFHRMFFKDINTFTEQSKTYNNIPDIRRHIGLADLSEELHSYNFSIIKRDVWNVCEAYSMGTFIAKKE